MRIIKGTHQRKTLRAPKNLPVRPTTDFAKEGLFNIISNRLEISTLDVLDLFSGTGGIAFEFASRGAKNVSIVDQNPKCIQYINKCVKDLAYENIKIRRADVFSYLKKTTDSFDIIFADPPYDLDKVKTLPDLILDHTTLLKKGGWLILEHGKQHDFSNHASFFMFRKYGNVNFCVFLKA